MAKPSRKIIESLLDEWGRSALKCAKIEATLKGDIQPLTDAYDKKCAPFNEAAKAKLQPLQGRMAELGAEISKLMLSGVGGDGSVSLPQVATEAAIAEVKNVEGARNIDPEKFFLQTPAARRDKRFWECVKIQVGKAEKLLGDVINAIAKKPTTTEVVIKLKS